MRKILTGKTHGEVSTRIRFALKDVLELRAVSFTLLYSKYLLLHNIVELEAQLTSVNMQLGFSIPPEEM